ncbi:hypothetical protein MLC59_02035 [Marinobacter bryozoorum]|uniref:hypothetical protein n=1 Tax=Marinobacter bryozoorum TaxID=256324 RepID=UPI002004911E|nr:hypothetical protein [Marinobacter bryozoorum]MCK7542949.1 hypothetical protein [Marinobacter bryozoorum]
MRREHIEANKLLDIAETGNRGAYRDALKEMEGRLRPEVSRQAAHLAKWQHQMYQRYHRLFAWRAEWKAGRRVQQ